MVSELFEALSCIHLLFFIVFTRTVEWFVIFTTIAHAGLLRCTFIPVEFFICNLFDLESSGTVALCHFTSCS